MDDWDDSVSMRLAALALDKGRLTDDLVTALAVRGTLLVDLALRGRVSSWAEPAAAGPAPQAVRPGHPRSSRRRILPVTVLGSSSTSSTLRGYL